VLFNYVAHLGFEVLMAMNMQFIEFATCDDAYFGRYLSMFRRKLLTQSSE
jgi:hypothetical protein